MVAVYFLKEGRDKSDPASYRLFCLLPDIGKVLDKKCTTRLVNYLEDNDMLDSSQYGFRRNCSIIDALHEVVV